MAKTELGTREIRDGSVKRNDLDVATAGESVIAKVVGGDNIELSSSGADSGTGDVTINSKLPLVPDLVPENQGVEYSLKVKSDLSGYEWVAKDLVITQNSHGFVLISNRPIPVYLDDNDNWLAARADNRDTLSAAFVTEVLDVNRFVLKIPEGQKILAPSHGLAIGQYYFLSDTSSGSVVVDQPNDRFDDVVYYVLDSNNIILKDNRPRDIETLQKFRSVFTSVDASRDYDFTSFIEMPLNVLSSEDKAGIYIISGNGVQVTRNRTYDLAFSFNFFQSGTNDRKRLEGQFFVNGSAIGKPFYSQFGRGSNSDRDWSLNAILESVVLDVGDVITFRLRRVTSDSTGTIRIRNAGEGFFRIQMK